jgi:trypsin
LARHRVEIVDPTNASSQSERVDESLLLPGSGRWSARVYGNSVAVKLHTTSKLTTYSLCVDAYSFSTQDAQIEPKLLIDGHTDHREDLLRTSVFYKLGHSIALVYFQKVGAAEDFSCSGFAISPWLFITNNHCISSEEQLSTAGVWYNYEVDNTESPLEIKFSRLVTANAYFDYTLLRLDKALEAQYIAHLLLSKLADTPPDIIQIQHPCCSSSEPLWISGPPSA